MTSTLAPVANIRSFASKVRTLNPEDDGFDDLEVLGKLVSEAKIVGVGEGAHFVTEFGMARARISRFLIERCGFTHIALELGRCEALKLSSWVNGEGSESDLSAYAGPLTIGLYGRFLRWLRYFNVSNSRAVQIVGPDLPNTLTIWDDLVFLRTYLSGVDPDVLATLSEAEGMGERIQGQSAVQAAGAWLSMSRSDRDALSSRLTRLFLRMQSLKSLYLESASLTEYEDALVHLESASCTVQMLESMSDLFEGKAVPGDTSVRDFHAATTLLKLCSRLPPESRIVLVAHNNHIQKTPVSFSGELTAYPAGHFLSKALGVGYKSLAVTHTDKSVPEMNFPAPDSVVGFVAEMLSLENAPVGSVERALMESQLDSDLTITNLRMEGAAVLGFDRMRSQSAYIVTSLHDAFDAIFSVPKVSLEPDLPF